MRPRIIRSEHFNYFSSDTQVQPVLSRVEARMRLAHENHLGYPYNLSFEPGVPASLGNYLINNLGDPYSGSHYASEVCELEREAIDWFMRLWDCSDPAQYWGSVGASGTEGNLWGIYLGREALPDAVLLHSSEAHYSIPKAARLQRIETEAIDCNSKGEIDLAALGEVLERLNGRPVIVVLTCGTTMKGAHDDIGGVIQLLDQIGCERYIHVDGALNATVIPFLGEAAEGIRPSFRHAIDSISTSGHKMIGTPMPCGVLVARKSHVERVATAIAYLRSNDTTLMGSRNGHAVLAIWSRVMSHGRHGFSIDAHVCVERAIGLADRLREADVPVLHNPLSLTVVFPEPSEAILRTYQLAPHRGQAHAIVMPSATEKLLSRFTNDYLNWWSASRRS